MLKKSEKTDAKKKDVERERQVLLEDAMNERQMKQLILKSDLDKAEKRERERQD